MSTVKINELGTGTPESTDFLAFANPTTGLAEKTTIAEIVALIEPLLTNKADLNGNDQETFEVADATATNQAVSKGQLDVAVNNLEGALIPQGNWNASTNTPDITGTTTTGYYWIVSADGSTSLGGITDWKTNDWAIKTATGWAKIDNSLPSTIAYQNVDNNFSTAQTFQQNITAQWGVFSINSSFANALRVGSTVNDEAGIYLGNDFETMLYKDSTGTSAQIQYRMQGTGSGNVVWYLDVNGNTVQDGGIQANGILSIQGGSAQIDLYDRTSNGDNVRYEFSGGQYRFRMLDDSASTNVIVSKVDLSNYLTTFNYGVTISAGGLGISGVTNSDDSVILSSSSSKYFWAKNTTGDNEIIIGSDNGANRIYSRQTTIATNPKPLYITMGNTDTFLFNQNGLYITEALDVAGNFQVGDYTVGANGDTTTVAKAMIFGSSGSDVLHLGLSDSAYPDRGWSFVLNEVGVNSNLIIAEHGLTGDRIQINSGGRFNILGGGLTVQDSIIKVGSSTGTNQVDSGTIDFLEDTNTDFGTLNAYGFRLNYNGNSNDFTLQSGSDTTVTNVFSIDRGATATFEILRNTNITGTLDVTNEIITSSSANSTPTAETAVFSKFGLLANRESMYLTNAGTNIIFGIGATHSANNVLTINSASATFGGLINMPDNKAVTWSGGSIRAEGTTLKLTASSLIDLQQNTDITGTLDVSDDISANNLTINTLGKITINTDSAQAGLEIKRSGLDTWDLRSTDNGLTFYNQTDTFKSLQLINFELFSRGLHYFDSGIDVTGNVNFASLPTSSTGLSAGDLWNDGGTVKIV